MGRNLRTMELLHSNHGVMLSVSAQSNGSLVEMISFHAAAMPQHAAVIDRKVQLSYAELDRRSSQLAAQLQERGAGPGACIGLFLERSSAFVVAALATLKTGAAYVPLDSSTPPDRAAFALADAGALAVITDSCKAESLPQRPRHVIDIHGLESTPLVPSSQIAYDPECLAYVIYTSGSTGEPKGVEITHGNLCNLIDWHQSAFAVTAADRASHVAGLGFDAAVWEIWPYLTSGATLVIADELTRRSAEALHDWFVLEGITIGFVPTILAEQLLRMSWPADTALRILLTGGDALRRCPAAGLPFTVVNNYGPTECTVVATSGTVSPIGADDCLPSIGRPIANANALILDEMLRPVPAGGAGELCLAGAIVGRGYRNQPELTASRFVTYMCTSGETQRIYRTGDRARLLENGEISFLGRLDDQVKIRGYRIELGEVAACLQRCDEIDTATVVVRDLENGGPSLVAYIVAARDAQVSDSSLRTFLAAHLPDYMIPRSFVSIAALPMTVNGKLDEDALPVPTAENVLTNRSRATDSAQNNALQQQISQLIASLVGREAIEPEDNFFMIGGHSMLGVQLVARIRDMFGVRLTLRQLFTAPTVAALSAEVARLTKAAP